MSDMYDECDERSFYIRCSNCETPLCQIWIRDDSESPKNEAVCKCDRCGDKSFVKKFDGQFFIGGTKFSTVENIDYVETKKDSSGNIEYQKILVETKGIHNYVRK